MKLRRILNMSVFLIVCLALGVYGLAHPTPARAADEIGAGYALSFDGVDDWVTASGQTLNGLGAFTAEAWVYHEGAFTSGYETIFEFSTTSPAANDAPYLGLLNGYPNFWQTCATSTTPLQPNRWTHMAWVKYNASSYAIYVDGVQVCYSTSSSSSFSGADMGIGGNGTDNSWKGKIDEVRLWSTGRSTDQIRSEMYRSAPLNQTGLFGRYRMSDGAGTTVTDDSGNGKTGVFHSAPLWVTSGAFAGPRQALDFDGANDTVSISGLTPPAAFTVEAWVYHSGGSFAAHDTIVEFGNDAPYLGLTSGKPEFFNTCTGNSALQHNRWYHLAWVKASSTSYAVYVDGEQVCSAITSISQFDGANMGIGGNSGDTFWAGMIDEVRLWNTGRTADQIRQDMYHTLDGNETGLAAYYRFDQTNAADQTTLYDLTASQKHGTLSGMDPNTDWVDSNPFNTWVGSEGTAWSTAANWSKGSAPLSGSKAGVYTWPGSSQPALDATANLGGLVIGPGATLNLGSAALNIAGNWSTYGSVTPGSSTATFNGSGTQALHGSPSFNHLTINPGVTLDPGSAELSIAGNLSINGTFQPGSSTVTFNGIGTQNLYSLPVTHFNNLTINSEAVVVETNLSGQNALVDGTLTNHGVLSKTLDKLSPGITNFGLAGASIDVTEFGDMTTLQVDRVGSAHLNENSAGGGAYILNIYYRLLPDFEPTTAEVCLPYTEAEFAAGSGGRSESSLRLCRWDSDNSVWACQERGAHSSIDTHQVCAAGMNHLSDWVIGAVGPTALRLTRFGASAAASPSAPAPAILLGLGGVGLLLLVQRRQRSG